MLAGVKTSTDVFWVNVGETGDVATANTTLWQSDLKDTMPAVRLE